MTKTEFIKFISDVDKIEESATALYKAGVDLTSITDNHWQLFSFLVDHLFGKHNSEIIHWFLWEKRVNPNLTMYDENNNEICRNPEELWEYVTSNHFCSCSSSE